MDAYIGTTISLIAELEVFIRDMKAGDVPTGPKLGSALVEKAKLLQSIIKETKALKQEYETKLKGMPRVEDMERRLKAAGTKHQEDLTKWSNDRAEAVQQAKNTAQVQIDELKNLMQTAENKEIGKLRAEKALLEGQLASFGNQKAEAVQSARDVMQTQVDGLNARLKDQAILVKTADENSQQMGWSTTYRTMYNLKCAENDALKKEIATWKTASTLDAKLEEVSRERKDKADAAAQARIKELQEKLSARSSAQLLLNELEKRFGLKIDNVANRILQSIADQPQSLANIHDTLDKCLVDQSTDIASRISTIVSEGIKGADDSRTLRDSILGQVSALKTHVTDTAARIEFSRKTTTDEAFKSVTKAVDDSLSRSASGLKQHISNVSASQDVPSNATLREGLKSVVSQHEKAIERSVSALRENLSERLQGQHDPSTANAIADLKHFITEHFNDAGRRTLQEVEGTITKHFDPRTAGSITDQVVELLSDAVRAAASSTPDADDRPAKRVRIAESLQPRAASTLEMRSSSLEEAEDIFVGVSGDLASLSTANIPSDARDLIQRQGTELNRETSQSKNALEATKCFFRQVKDKQRSHWNSDNNDRRCPDCARGDRTCFFFVAEDRIRIFVD